MQYKKDLLYKTIHEQYPDMTKEFIQEYLYHILDRIKEWSISPDNLILTVKGLGRFYWKKKNLYRDYTQRVQYTDPSFKNAADHRRFVDVSEFVLNRYKDFEEKKDLIKRENHGEDYKPPEQVKAEYKEFLKLKRKR